MGKSKISGSGSGYVGEVMVHRITREIGIVETVIEAQAGWAPQVTVKLKDGSIKKGKLSDFREASGHEKRKFTEDQPAPAPEKAAAPKKGK